MSELTEVPKEIRYAALYIEEWFKQHNIQNWELCGICSRNFAFELKAAMEKIKELETKLNKFKAYYD